MEHQEMMQLLSLLEKIAETDEEPVADFLMNSRLVKQSILEDAEVCDRVVGFLTNANRIKG